MRRIEWGTMKTQHRAEEIASTVIEPVGDLTPELVGVLWDAIREARLSGRQVVISLRRTARLSWAGLCMLVERVHADLLGAPVRFMGVVPRKESLLRAAGLGPAWIVDERSVTPGTRIVVAA